MNLHVVDAGTLAYRPAWNLQLQLHERVLSGALAEGALLLVEHPPVITFGRRASSGEHLLVSRPALAERGVELVESDRGGDITFHGPGQLVAYPILNLNHLHINVHQYMRWLEDVVMATAAGFGIQTVRSSGATGVWVETETGMAKLCAMGVKVRKWITLHGLALNVNTDLRYFDLINPCGLSLPVTSMQRVLGEKTPNMAEVKAQLVRQFAHGVSKA